MWGSATYLIDLDAGSCHLSHQLGYGGPATYLIDLDVGIRMEVASLRLDHLSSAKTSKLSLLVKSPFGSGAADVGNATPTFCFSVPGISKPTTLTVKSLWTAPTKTAKHHILAIDEAS